MASCCCLHRLPILPVGNRPPHGVESPKHKECLSRKVRPSTLGRNLMRRTAHTSLCCIVCPRRFGTSTPHRQVGTGEAKQQYRVRQLGLLVYDLHPGDASTYLPLSIAIHLVYNIDPSCPVAKQHCRPSKNPPALLPSSGLLRWLPSASAFASLLCLVSPGLPAVEPSSARFLFRVCSLIDSLW